MLHMIFFKCLISIFLIIALTACTDDQGDEGLKGVNSFHIEAVDLPVSVNSNLPDDMMNKRQADRRIAAYEERNAIAYVIVKDELIDMSTIRAEIKRSRNEIIIKNYFNKYVENATNDAAVQKYYDEHVDEFTIKRAHVAQILIRVTPDDDKNTQAELHKKALKIADELRRDGSFEDAVKQHSEDLKTRSKAGDLGWIETGKTNSAIMDSVMSLNMGEIPQPILSPQGYHIVKLLEPIERNVSSLDEVKQKILYKLKYEEKLSELKRLKELAKNEIGNLK